MPVIASGGDTDRFTYYVTNETPFILLQSGAVSIGTEAGKLLYSSDNGATWDREIAFADVANIRYSAIMPNGNVVWATERRFYVSTDQLQTITEVTPQNADGSPFVFHTPQNSSRGGHYFGSQVNRWVEVPGRGVMMCMGNYGNVTGGAVPTVIWYSVDQGLTIKACYVFGQNPWHRDNGTEAGGTTGTLLGDPSNPVITRHVHNGSAVYSPTENVWYVFTGDHDRAGPVYECHWLRGEYDWDADEWTWAVVWSGSEGARWKSSGVVCFDDGRVVWASDATGGNIDHTMGIYRAASPLEIFDPDKARLIGNTGYKMGGTAQSGLTAIYRPHPQVTGLKTMLYVTIDGGDTWGLYDLTADIGARSIAQHQGPNAAGDWRSTVFGTAWGASPTGELFWWKPKV